MDIDFGIYRIMNKKRVGGLNQIYVTTPFAKKLASVKSSVKYRTDFLNPPAPYKIGQMVAIRFMVDLTLDTISM